MIYCVTKNILKYRDTFESENSFVLLKCSASINDTSNVCIALQEIFNVMIIKQAFVRDLFAI